MADGFFPDPQAGGSEQSGKIPVHPLERDEKTDVFPFHDFEGTAGIVGPVEQDRPTDGVGDAGGDPFLPGVAPWGADAAGEIGLSGADQLQQGRQVGGIVLAVTIHHRGKRSAGSQQPGVESRALAEIFGEVDHPNSCFGVQQCGGAVPTAVINRDDFGAWHSGAGFGDHRRNIFLFVVEGNDEG